MQPNQDARVEGEIDLVEFWGILVRRKMWIAAVLLASLAAAVAYLVLKAPVYEASVRLRIGQVAGAGLFEPADVLSSRLIARYGEDVADGIRRDRPFLRRATPSKLTPGVVDLVSEGHAPGDAASLLERVFADVVKTHGEIYSGNRAFLEERLRNIDAQRAALRRQYDEASVLVNQLKQSDPVQASLIVLDRSSIAESITTLDAERPQVAQKLSPPQTQPTELLGDVVAPVKPASPKKALVLVLAAILGTVAGLVLALIAEAAGKARAAPGQ